MTNPFLSWRCWQNRCIYTVFSQCTLGVGWQTTVWDFWIPAVGRVTKWKRTFFSKERGTFLIFLGRSCWTFLFIHFNSKYFNFVLDKFISLQKPFLCISGLRLRKSKSDKMFFGNICWVPSTTAIDSIWFYDSNNWCSLLPEFNCSMESWLPLR